LDQHDDEIDLLDLVKALLATWKIWLIALILVTGLYGAFVAAKILFVSSEVTYSKPIRLTFLNAHNFVFPNGAPFSFGDIVAPAVVQTAHQRNRLDEYGMSVADLQGSLSAAPYAPTYPLILERYARQMADKRLTIEQLAQVQARMESELAQATAGTVLISMRLNKHYLPESVASKVLSDIPAIWAERTIKDKGVLNLDIELVSSKSLNPDLIQQVEYMIVSDLLGEKLKLLRENINKLSKFEGVLTIVDPETDMKLADLENAIDDLSRYVIDDLMSPVRYLGLSRDPQLSIFYYEDRLKKLTMELALLDNQARLAKDAYDNYRRSEHVVAPGGDVSGTTVSQFGGDTLDKLLQMSGESEREAYKQRLNEQWLEFNLSAARVKNSIDDVELILLSLRAADESQSPEQVEKHQSYLDRVNTSLPTILNQLDGYFKVTERIYNQLNIETVGIRDRLYSPITNRVITEKESLEIKKTILVWFALLFLTSAVVVPATMIRNAMKQN
jgi:hypothetical protein